MSHNSQMASRPAMNPTSKMSFAVATCAFAAAAVGLLVNHWMSGWMAVGGMAGVGLFYLAVGVLNLGAANPIYLGDSDFAETSAHRLSGAANVDDFSVERKHEVVDATRNDKLANARN